MNQKKITTSYVIYQSADELSDADQHLLKTAEKAIKNAYAPYSHFHVGAAVLLDNGAIVTGNNQENAAYPSGMCAERIAVWNAASQFSGHKIVKIAIKAQSQTKITDKPVAPCGACRQTLLEYEINQKQPITIFFTGDHGPVIQVESLEDLLPFAFDQSYL